MVGKIVLDIGGIKPFFQLLGFGPLIMGSEIVPQRKTAKITVALRKRVEIAAGPNMGVPIKKIEIESEAENKKSADGGNGFDGGLRGHRLEARGQQPKGPVSV